MQLILFLSRALLPDMTQSTTLGSRYRLEEMDTEMKRKHPLKRSSLRWLPIYGSCPLIFRMLLWFGLVISVVPSISETKDQCSRYVSGYWNNSFHRKWNSASYLCYKEGVEVLMKGSWGWGAGHYCFSKQTITENRSFSLNLPPLWE